MLCYVFYINIFCIVDFLDTRLTKGKQYLCAHNRHAFTSGNEKKSTFLILIIVIFFLTFSYKLNKISFLEG